MAVPAKKTHRSGLVARFRIAGFIVVTIAKSYEERITSLALSTVYPKSITAGRQRKRSTLTHFLRLCNRMTCRLE